MDDATQICYHTRKLKVKWKNKTTTLGSNAVYSCKKDYRQKYIRCWLA